MSAFLNSRIDRYEIQERIGRGGMAQVFKARDTNLDRIVAVKILHEYLGDDGTFKERFEREAKFIASLNHPNIVPIFDFNMVERDGTDICYMVMPYIPGKTLKDLLEEMSDKGQKLDRDRVLKIMLDLTDALGYAHERGMIHRDVKPGNILFDERGRAVLADFGLARLNASTRLTEEGITTGTPAYMSPERVRGLDVDGRSDLYSLGIILYEMLTGRPPFDDDSISVLLKHLNEPVPLLSKVLMADDPELDAVMHTALAKEPEARFQTAADFALHLKAAFAGETITQFMAHPPAPSLRTSQINAVSVNTSAALPAVSQPSSRISRQSVLIGLAVALSLVALVTVVAVLLNPAMMQAAVLPTNADTGSSDSSASMTGSLYFNSTFSETDNFREGWPQGTDGGVARSFLPEGFYRVSSAEADTASVAVFNEDYTYDNVTIRMSALLEDNSSPASAYGIIFNYIDEDNYNTLTIDGLGRFSIWTRESGTWRELRGADEEWTVDEVIEPIGSENELSISIRGETLLGTVNNRQLVNVQDSTFAEGGIGIYLGTDNGPASVLIDSFRVDASVPSMTGGGGA